MSNYNMKHYLAQTTIKIPAPNKPVSYRLSEYWLEYFIGLLQVPVLSIVETEQGAILIADNADFCNEVNFIPAYEYPILENLDGMTIHSSACMYLSAIAAIASMDRIAGRRGRQAYIRPGFADMLEFIYPLLLESFETGLTIEVLPLDKAQWDDGSSPSYKKWLALEKAQKTSMEQASKLVTAEMVL